MSLAVIIELENKIRSLPFDSREREKYESLLEAEVIKVAPKLIRDAYRVFKIELRFNYTVDESDLERVIDRLIDEINEKTPYILELKDGKRKLAEITIKLYDWNIDLRRGSKAFEVKKYDVTYDGSVFFYTEVPAKDVSLKWRSRIIEKGLGVFGISIYTLV